MREVRNTPVQLVIVDDSATARLALKKAFAIDPDIVVVGEAATGREALAAVKRLKPDLVTMDVYLGMESGIDVIGHIMAEAPCPVVVVTGASLENSKLSYQAISAGALEVRSKLPSWRNEGYEASRMHLVRLVKSLSQVPVVHHFRRAQRLKSPESERPLREGAPVPRPAIKTELTGASLAQPPRVRELVRGPRNIALVAMGASTGGPGVVQTVLSGLPAPFPLPIVFVQHITAGFGRGFAKWLASVTGHEVVYTESLMKLEPGRVFVAQDDHHLVLHSSSFIGPSLGERVAFQRPSIDVLFDSAARHFGGQVLSVLMSGMGSDGVDGMARLRQGGALTLAQEPESCVVGSMPQQAILRGAAELVCHPERMAETILSRLALPATITSSR